MELPSPKVIMIIAGIVFIVLTITEDEAPDGKAQTPRRNGPCETPVMPLALEPRSFTPVYPNKRRPHLATPAMALADALGRLPTWLTETT